jgi:hydrogenase/urease accessory protein HupE
VPERIDAGDGESADATDSDAGVDFGWVMQVTFVVTIIVGAPVVALLSAGVTLPTWEARVSFAIRVGAVVWLCTAVGVYVYARRER